MCSLYEIATEKLKALLIIMCQVSADNTSGAKIAKFDHRSSIMLRLLRVSR